MKKKKQLSFKTDIFLYGIICRPLETVGVSVGCKGAPVSLLLLEWKQQLFWIDREHHFLRNASGDSFNYLQSTNLYSSLFFELCPKINLFKYNKKVTYLKILTSEFFPKLPQWVIFEKSAKISMQQKSSTKWQYSIHSSNAYFSFSRVQNARSDLMR